MSMKPAKSAKASFPWLLLVTGSSLGLAMVLAGPKPGFQTTTAGRAQLTRALAPNQPGWQFQIDPVGLGLNIPETQTLLSSILQEEVQLSPQDGAPLFSLTKIDGSELSVLAEPPVGRPPGADKLFGGGPSIVFEWSKKAFNVRGTLFSKSGTSTLLSGRLVGTLPFTGIQAAGPGFAFDRIGLLPPDIDSLMAIDPTILRFLATYREPVQKEWDRWEFLPFTTLGKALGPALVYARWRGEALFCIGVKDMAAVETEISKRFPEAVIRTAARWSYGSRIRGFDPDGPAWLLRGDVLLATKIGGTRRLESALQSVLDKQDNATPFVQPNRLMPELARLAATESGWHIVIIKSEPDSPIHWGALIRWPEDALGQAVGYLVVEPNPAYSGSTTRAPKAN